MSEQDNAPEAGTRDRPAAEDEQAMRFDTVKVYLKDASFEAPSTPKIFTETRFQPRMDVQYGIDYRDIDEKSGIIEVVLKATATANFNDNVVYIAEVHQAGLFRILHPSEDTRQAVIEIACPTILLPFAREEINALVTKGGFSAFLISPVNFESLFRQRREKSAESSEEPGESGSGDEAPQQTH